jgi:hypothetical protein
MLCKFEMTGYHIRTKIVLRYVAVFRQLYRTRKRYDISLDIRNPAAYLVYTSAIRATYNEIPMTHLIPRSYTYGLNNTYRGPRYQLDQLPPKYVYRRASSLGMDRTRLNGPSNGYQHPKAPY